MFSHAELDLSIEYISNDCSLWDSGSRCDSNNAYSEFLRSKFWISMSYSIEHNFLWTEFSPRVACWALRSRCPRRSRSSEQNSLWLFREWLLILFRRLYLDINSATLITEPFLSSLSLSVLQRFPDCMLSLLSFRGTKSSMRNVQKRGFKHCENTELSSVLAYGFREVGEIVVQILDGRRVIVHGSDLVQLFWVS